MTGSVNEPSKNAPLNSGMFAAVLRRGDVSGIFFGHDHTNTFTGVVGGVTLGYSGSAGYAHYGLGGEFAENHALRGGRIIEVRESDPYNFTTRMVFAADYGMNEVDLNK